MDFDDWLSLKKVLDAEILSSTIKAESQRS
jgi:hypothetical protein